MKKVILQFTKGHGRYVTGDVAGFEKEAAQKLREVTRPYDTAAKSAVAESTLLDTREADLVARELELVDRKAAAAEVVAPAGKPPAQGGGIKS